MTSFTFSAEQVKSAPPEVRHWIENEIIKALALPPHAVPESSTAHENALAACSVDEVAQVFNLISGNFLVTQVFFELARETHLARPIPPLHALNLSDIQRHVQIADGEVLIQCLNVINQALQRVRNNPDTSLFGSDEQGHIFVHQMTHQNIRQLREKLALAHAAALQNSSGGAPVFTPDSREGQGSGMQPEHAFAQPPQA
ncbi:MAG TPA: hypothetical protein VME69_06080 [Methylocella sp.]|nr:hypothetical protein [Methylocella sp.]